MTRYRLVHETVYAYGDAVAVSHNVAHLLPRERRGQRLAGSQIRISPAPTTLRGFRDYFGNPAVFFIVEEPHERLVVRAESRVEVEACAEPAPEDSPAWEEVAAEVHRAARPETLDAFEFVFDSPFVAASEALRDYARPSFPPGRPLLAGALDLCRRVHREFRYDPKATTLATPIAEVLEARHGVCQDFAHGMIGALRSLGLPARYVSGYIRSRPPAEPRDAPPAEAELVGAEASHAWVSVFCPRNGWVDLDPTNDLLPADRHATLAWGRDYDDVSPIQGVTLGGGLQTVSVGVQMRPWNEEARVTPS